MKKIGAAAIAVAALAAGGSAATADSGSAYCGAKNMLNAWPGKGPGEGVAVQFGGGMQNAMSVDSLNGNAGMRTAIIASAGSCG